MDDVCTKKRTNKLLKWENILHYNFLWGKFNIIVMEVLVGFKNSTSYMEKLGIWETPYLKVSEQKFYYLKSNVSFITTFIHHV
jgi:hypothetical protein